MEPVESTTSYNDLIQVITALSFWSKESMQKFLESGLPNDVKEATLIQGVDVSIKDTYRFLIDDFCDASPASLRHQSEATLSQAIKLFDFAPRDNIGWTNFFRIMSALGQRSHFFSFCGVTFEERDRLRGLMGLSPINPILKNQTNGIEIVFRRTGHCNYKVWENVPAGYRFADKEELDGVLIPEEIKKVGYVFLKPTFCRVVSLLDFRQNEIVEYVDVYEFFHNNVFYIPLVKL